MASSSFELQPAFLGSSPDRHYILQFRSLQTPRGHIVYIPPFGEEMNRCRALVAEQARAFAEMGYHCTLVDFFGTGDSEGHLVDADLSIWRENVLATLESVTAQSNVPVTLWGIRLGALMALDIAQALSVDSPVQRLLLWQPVTSGKRYVTQLLRQRVASRVSLGLESETTTEIRQRLQAGEAVEISGYVVRESLIGGLEQLKMPDFSRGNPLDIIWLENSEGVDDELPTAARKAVDALAGGDVTVRVERFIAPPIWQLHERDQAPDLIEKTLQIFS